MPSRPRFVKQTIPSPQNALKIISLGGFSDVQRNMYVYELPTRQDAGQTVGGDILLIDCGIGFPTEEMLGVDLLIPDIQYLKGKESRIKGMLITHGHEDHVGALPYILPKLPKFPIYASRLAAAIGEDKLKENFIDRSINVIDPTKTLQIGSFTVKSIRMSHSIPDTYHYCINTPYGNVYHGADFKFDWTPVDGIQPEVGKIALAGNNGVDLLISDCLGSERKGATRSELDLNEMFIREISRCNGKFIVTTMSSSISRWQQAITVSVERGRKIVPVGRSVEKNLKIAIDLGYLKVKPELMLQMDRIRGYSDNQLTYLVAGSQGQPGSALQRIAAGEHDRVRINPGDKVIFSTDYIPGSETSIHASIDALYRQGATVVYADIKDDLHVSGHGSRDDLKLLLGLTRPKSALPIGGTYRHMTHYKMIAENMGHQSDKILMPQTNQCIYLSNNGTSLGEEIDVQNIMVDGLGVGDVGKVILRDRQVLAEEGVVVVLLQLDANSKELVGDPDIITRGFVYVKGQEHILQQAKKLLKKTLHSDKHLLTDFHLVKELTSDKLRDFFARQLNRYPMILPVIIEV